MHGLHSFDAGHISLAVNIDALCGTEFVKHTFLSSYFVSLKLDKGISLSSLKPSMQLSKSVSP